jgi:hypothetical protein
MNIFNKMIPWFIPTKDDQRTWYRQEVLDSPKEIQGLTHEFEEISKEYHSKLGELESRISEDFKLYKLYTEVKQLAQKTSLTWDRIGIKQGRAEELTKRLMEL